jgi:hypothetical protein
LSDYFVEIIFRTHLDFLSVEGPTAD